MKNTPFRSAHSLPLLRRIADSRILVIVLLTMMFAYEAEAQNSGSATRTISEDGLTSTWTELNFTVDKSTTYGNNGLYFNAGTDGNISTDKGAVNIKIGRIMYVLVPSATATGTLTIVGSNTSSDRTVKLNSGQTIAMTNDNGASAAFVTTDIETITEQGYEGTYIKVISQSDFKFTSVQVTLTNGNYKEETPTCTPPGLAFSEASCTVPLGETFTSPSLTNSHNLSISYSSSDPNVATIDTEGKVTILDAGQTTITAISEADETYCAGEASYILTVTSPQCAAPNISKQPTSVEISVGETATLSIEATGDNLSYQWYTCDQDGNNETAIDGVTTTIYEAIPTEAGTTYYKVVVTGTCESVSSDIASITAKEIIDTGCETYVYYHVAPEGKENSDRFTFSETLKGNNTINNKMTIDDTEYTCNSRSGSTTASFTLTVTDGKKADLYMCVCGGGGTRFMKAVSDKGDEKSISINNHVNEDKTYKTFTLTDLESGTWTITCYEKETDTAGKSWYLSMLGLHECRTKPAAPISYAEASFSSPFSNKPNTPQEIIISAEETAIATIKELITYTSSNPDVATIDAATGEVTYKMLGTTTITATFEGNDEYASGSASYTLHVVAPAGKEFSATLSADNPSIGCNNATLSVTIKPDNASVSQYKWYSCDADGSNETLITDAAEATYTTDVAGTYKVLVTANGYPQWTNTVTITKEEPESVEIKRLTPFHYYRYACKYDSVVDHPIRHLFLVESKGMTPTEGKSAYTIRLSKKATNGTTTNTNITEYPSGWLYENGDTLMMNLQQFPAFMVADWAKEKQGTQGDTLVISLVPLNSCGNYDEAKSVSMDIIVTETNRRALAFIVSGCSAEGTDEFGGDFFKGINPHNLQLQVGLNTWNSSQKGKLWGGLTESPIFIPTAVNGYADFDIFNYEPFDIIMLTDYVRTNMSGIEPTISLASFDKLANLVDYRPILSLKSHMSRDGLPSWHKLGFIGNPQSPVKVKDMNVLCLGHAIFSGLSEKYFDSKGDGILKVLETPQSVGYYDRNIGLQGFYSRDLVGFINIGYIDKDADGNALSEPLIACCDRQTNPDARLMILSINSSASPMLTDEGGIAAIRAMLRYLLKTDPKDIEDCSNVFDNGENRTDQQGKIVEVAGAGDHKWSNKANWTYGRLPMLASNVQILANCTVDVMDAAAGSIKIRTKKLLTIDTIASLRVAKRFGLKDETDNLKMKPLPSDNYNIVTIKANENGSGTLIHSSFGQSAEHPDAYEIPATVEYYSIASGAPDNCQWQWMTIPVQDVARAVVPFEGAWLYEWDDSKKKFGIYLRNDSSMHAFRAYCFTQRTEDKKKGKIYRIQGKLVNIEDGKKEVALTYSNDANIQEVRRGINVIGNSWTAPINISKFEKSDFVNCTEACIILFNTGYDPTGNKYTEAGQYSVIPIETAAEMGKEYQVIPAMQTFQVNAAGPGAKLIMDYDRLVRTDKVNYQPMRVHGRKDTAEESTKESGITERLRIRVQGERYGDIVHIFRNADCTSGFDNGWDGRKMYGDAAALQLFVESDGEQYAVSTQPELAGTRLGFMKGEDNSYTMSFEYDGADALYLYDSESTQYILIESGSTYRFRSESNKQEHRFLITDYSPAEGIVDIEQSENTLILSNTTKEPVILSIYDAAGHLCHQQTLREPLVTLSVPDQPGVYLVEARSKTQRITHKVVL